MLRGLIIYGVCLHELIHYLDWEYDEEMQDDIEIGLELGILFEQLNNGGYFEIDPDGNIIFIQD